MSHPVPCTVHGYHLLQLIGQGTAGSVYRARPQSSHLPTSSPASQVAVKIIPRSKVRDAVRREVAIHINLSHPNIVNLHRVLPAAPPSHPSLSFPPSQPPALALVLDYAPGGDMFNEVASAGSLPPRTLRRRLRDIASALNYLHNNNTLHLDVKLENVVITNSSTAKLIDFGCARTIHPDKHHRQAPLGGTLHYLPPELVENPNTPPAPASDAWSLGVLAYTALAGCYPFNAATAATSQHENDHATRHRIVNCHPHSIPASVDLPSDLRRIVYGLLDKNPSTRMTIPQVLTELSNSMTATNIGLQIKLPTSHNSSASIDCNCRRPRSPASTTEADFGPCTCGTKQSREQALEIVDSIQRNSAQAAAGVRRYLSEFNATSCPFSGHGD